MATAFVRKVGTRCDISVNRLQSFLGQSRSGAVNCIRREVQGGLTLRKRGRFVVVNVGKVKSAAWEEGSALRVIYSPDRGGPSHSSIIDLPDEHKEELRVATAIMRLVTHHDIYPGLLEPSS